MYKMMFVLHERANMNVADALTYWKTKHADIVRKVTQVKKYTQSHALKAPDGGKSPVLGFAFLEFADEGDFAAAMGSKEMAAAFADIPNFADETKVEAAIVSDIGII
jgi:uncharacterized protein (TIGR02118 family)